MVTECYIKGRFDFGVGKCAVVIVEDVKPPGEKKILHQVAWKVPEYWEYKGQMIEADQFNCEIVAAAYALQWCTSHFKPLVNLYSNLSTCQKWYLRGEFPDSRQASAEMFRDALKAYYKAVNEHEGVKVVDRFFAEWIPKDSDEAKYAEWNWLVNDIALRAK